MAGNTLFYALCRVLLMADIALFIVLGNIFLTVGLPINCFGAPCERVALLPTGSAVD